MRGSKARKAAVLVIGITVAGSAMAWGWGDKDGGGYRHQGRPEIMGFCGMQGGMGPGGGPFADKLDRELSASQIQTLAEARLIRMGNENLKVGKVTPTDNGYSVSIVTVKSGDLVQSFDLAKNGLPVRMMERWEALQKARN